MMAAVAAAITLGELVGAGAGGSVGISDLTLDSRTAAPGSAFVAVEGTREHGLAYADEALARGAEVVLYDPATAAGRLGSAAGSDPRYFAVPGLAARFGELARRLYWRESPQPALFGVTGTNGKTTVAWLVAQALCRLGGDAAYSGTLGWGRPDRLDRHALTTPDCFTLHRELASLGVAAAALEVSSHGLAQNRVAGLDFVATAVTNLTRDHLDAHGSMDAYARTKSRIIELPGLESVVLNADDAFASGLAGRVRDGIRVLRVSRAGARAEIGAAVTDHGIDGLDLDIRWGTLRTRLVSPLIGDFNAENLLVALGLVVAAGHGLDEACASLGACRAAPGRLEVFRRADGLSVVVDYAHTPDALARALDAVAALGCRGDVIAVFGCGGDRDRGKRPLMGQAAARASRVVLTDDNPRSEDPARIVAEIRQGLRAGQPVVVEHDRARAIQLAIGDAGPDDVVIVAGKGHEDTQAIGRTVRPLDDRAVVRAAIGALG